MFKLQLNGKTNKKGNTTRKFLKKKPLKCKIETHYILNKVFKTVKSNMKTMFKGGVKKRQN